MDKNILHNVNFDKFEDEFGNLINEYEIVKYEKSLKGQWEEYKRFNSGRNYYIVQEKIYNRCDPYLIELNMNFDSKDFSVCYQIGNIINDARKKKF